MSSNNFLEVEALRIAALLKATSQLSNTYDVQCAALHSVIVELGCLNTLKQLVVHGPVEDGDVLSKSQRDFMISLGLASRVCVKNEQGYTAANYIGWGVYKADQH